MEILIILIIIVIGITLVGNKLSKRKVDKKSFGKKSITANGNTVRSNSEKLIADYLTNMGIDYMYEPRMFGFRPDFYLPEFDIIVEYWGLLEATDSTGTKYRRSMIKKIKIYLQNEQKLISIFPKDISSRQYMLKLDTIL